MPWLGMFAHTMDKVYITMSIQKLWFEKKIWQVNTAT